MHSHPHPHTHASIPTQTHSCYLHNRHFISINLIYILYKCGASEVPNVKRVKGSLCVRLAVGLPASMPVCVCDCVCVLVVRGGLVCVPALVACVCV